MVSSETLQVIIDAKDMLSSKANQVKNALKQTGQAAQQANNQAANSSNRVGTTYDRLRTRITNAWNGIRNTIKNATSGQTVNEASLSRPFMNAAEKIKQNYSSMVQNVKSKLKDIGTVRTITIKGDNGDVVKKIDITKRQLQQIKELKVDPFKNISTAGVKTLNGEIAELNAKVKTVGTSAGTTGNQVKTTSTSFNLLKGVGLTAVNGLKTGFAKLTTTISTVKGKVSNLLSGISGMQSVIMGAFGALGVTSMKSFIIEAGLAREKVQAVTKSIVGSGEAFKRMDSAIKTAVAGTTLGYNNVAKAVNNVGLRYKMTASQLEKVPGVMTKVGLMAQAMGKSNEEAAKMMEAAYDGLMGKWRSLKTLGITKEDLIAAGWSGAADDVNGYSDALEKVLSKNPKLKEMMNTTEYKMESLKMAVKGVGTEIGLALLPYIKGLLNFLLDLKKNNPELFKLIVVIGVVIAVVSSLAMVLLPIAMLLSAIGGTAAIVIVIIAAFAAGVYLAYTHFQQVRDVMQPVIQAFKDLGQAFQDLMNGKISIWDFLGKLLWALAQIPTIIPRVIAGLLAVVWDWLIGELGKIGAGIADWITNGFNNLSNWITSGFNNIVSTLTSAGSGLLSWVGDLFTSAGSSLRDSLNGVFEWIGTGFASLMEGALGFLGTFWDNLVVWGQNLYTNIVTWFTTTLPLILEQIGLLFINIINGVTTFGNNLLMQLGVWFANIIMSVITFLMNLYNNFVIWASNIVNGFILWISTLPGRMYLWLMDAYNRASQWAIQTINKFKDAANKSVSGFIQWLSTLPGKAWTWLMNTISKITSFASQAIEKMKNAAKDACDKFIQYFKDLPQKVWDELMRIGDKILQAGGTLAQKARELGQRIVDELMAPFQFGSPGIISRSVAAEMVYLKEFLDDSVHPLVKSASNVGTSVTDALSKNLDLNQDTLEALQDENLILKTVKDYEDGTLTLKHESKDDEIKLLNDLKGLFVDLIGILTTDENNKLGKQSNAVVINSINNADSDDILNILRNHIDDRDIIRQIASSPDFQEIDNRNKTMILNRLNRHL